MQSLLVTLLLVVIVLAAVIGTINQVSRSEIYDQIGKGGLSMDGHEADSFGAADSERAERELEVRQMLAARNDRIVRNGGKPPDLEAEVARLTGSAPDG